MLAQEGPTPSCPLCLEELTKPRKEKPPSLLELPLHRFRLTKDKMHRGQGQTAEAGWVWRGTLKAVGEIGNPKEAIYGPWN